MKTVPVSIQSMLDTRHLTMATCVRLAPVNSAVIGFTDHDADLEVSGVTYKSLAGYTPTSIKSTATLSVDNLDIVGLLTDLGVTEADIIAGVYDFAEMRLFTVDYTNPAAGEGKFKKGNLGEIRAADMFFAEFRSLTHELQQVIGDVRSPYCRAVHGSTRCGVNLATITVTGTITGVTDNSVFADSARTEADDYFNYGVFTFTSGNNAGRSKEVKDFTLTGGIFELTEDMPYAVANGDEYTVYPGCDRTWETCNNKFANQNRFRGEPPHLTPEANDYHSYGGQT